MSTAYSDYAQELAEKYALDIEKIVPIAETAAEIAAAFSMSFEEAMGNFAEAIAKQTPPPFLTIHVPRWPDMEELRDRLAAMSPLRRWLSWRMRRRLQRRECERRQALLNAVLEEGRKAVGK